MISEHEIFISELEKIMNDPSTKLGIKFVMRKTIERLMHDENNYAIGELVNNEDNIGLFSIVESIRDNPDNFSKHAIAGAMQKILDLKSISGKEIKDFKGFVSAPISATCKMTGAASDSFKKQMKYEDVPMFLGVDFDEIWEVMLKEGRLDANK